MTRDHRYDYMKHAGIGKGAKKILRASPLRLALREFETMETGLGQLPFPAPPSQFPIQRVPMALPRTPLEIQTQAQAQQKPGIVDQLLKPITQVAVLGIGALVLINIVPPILEHMSRKRSSN